DYVVVQTVYHMIYHDEANPDVPTKNTPSTPSDRAPSQLPSRPTRRSSDLVSKLTSSSAASAVRAEPRLQPRTRGRDVAGMRIGGHDSDPPMADQSRRLPSPRVNPRLGCCQ